MLLFEAEEIYGNRASAGRGSYAERDWTAEPNNGGL
jgi:hypothetical protein